MDDTLADLLTGRMLDERYAVTARIAHGGMATVYRATDTRLDREVALKVMHAELARDEEFRRRFIGEARSVARLSHQNVVGVFDQGADGPYLYLAMEYVPGRTLKEVLAGSGLFPPATALEIMTGVLDGLAAAHACGIVHRDVKPENVLVTADGRVKVADFGLARAQWAAGHTRKGLLIGTVAYVPPEQVTGGSTGPRADVYSAGVMLFELLTGRLPYTGDSPLSIAYQHVNSDVPAPSAVVPGIPPAADKLVLAATSRDPARRPADAGEFGRAVRLVREGLAGSGGLTGVMGVCVQGRGEAPRPGLDTPAAADGWRARGGTGSHTLVVDRGDGGRYGGREPFLGRWLFGPRLLIFAAVLALGVALGLGGWWLGSGRFAQVPSVAGDSVRLAATVLATDGFTVKGSTPVPSNTVARGTVAGTRPSGRVPRGTAITILVSAGPLTSVVPDVTGESQDAAVAALRRVHLTATAQKVGSDAPVGTVVGTNPLPGTTWPQAKPVTIMVAGGPAVPDFRGRGVQVALDWAAQHDARLEQQPDSSSQQPPGTVTGQQPAGGTLYQPGETVTVTVSSGPAMVNVPYVIGESVERATRVLRNAGFRVRVNRYGPFDTVFNFSPVTEAPRGSTITIDAGF